MHKSSKDENHRSRTVVARVREFKVYETFPRGIDHNVNVIDFRIKT